MGKIELKYSKQFIDDVADLSFFIENQGLAETSKKYVENLLKYLSKLNFDTVEYAYCLDMDRREAGLKCISYKKKYTIVFYQFEHEVIFIEFIPSKLLK